MVGMGGGNGSYAVYPSVVSYAIPDRIKLMSGFTVAGMTCQSAHGLPRWTGCRVASTSIGLRRMRGPW